MMLTLEGHTALVTGAGRGMGRAIALRLAREGARVAVADIDEQGIAAVAEEIRAAGGEALPVQLDVSREESVNEGYSRSARGWVRSRSSSITLGSSVILLSWSLPCRIGL